MRITNTSPYGDLDIPLLGVIVEAGQTVDVTEDQARRLLPQVENYAPADDEARAIAAELIPADDDQAPAPKEPKAAWVAWARKNGDDDPESKTKADLIELYGPTED
jgi:hypothetical protein